MWLIAPDTFVSIVHQPEWCGPDELVVRARRRADLYAFGVPDADVIHTPNADYPYRANVARDDVAQELAVRAYQLAYGNMKAQVGGHVRHTAYGRCWLALRALEDDDARPRPPDPEQLELNDPDPVPPAV